MNKVFYKLKESKFFQFLVITIIIFNAFTIGINTYELSEFSNQDGAFQKLFNYI